MLNGDSAAAAQERFVVDFRQSGVGRFRRFELDERVRRHRSADFDVLHRQSREEFDDAARQRVLREVRNEHRAALREARERVRLPER